MAYMSMGQSEPSRARRSVFWSVFASTRINEHLARDRAKNRKSERLRAILRGAAVRHGKVSLQKFL